MENMSDKKLKTALAKMQNSGYYSDGLEGLSFSFYVRLSCMVPLT